jgi:hypothetical protein
VRVGMYGCQGMLYHTRTGFFGLPLRIPFEHTVLDSPYKMNVQIRLYSTLFLEKFRMWHNVKIYNRVV